LSPQARWCSSGSGRWRRRAPATEISTALTSVEGRIFEKDAATARWPHFVRNRGSVPVEAVVVAFDVPQVGSPRTEADAPKECADPN